MIRQGIRLSTYCFPLEDVQLLYKVLTEKFGLDSVMHKGSHIIYVLSGSRSASGLLVRPYFHPSMLYKLDPAAKPPYTSLSAFLNDGPLSRSQTKFPPTAPFMDPAGVL